MTNEQELEQIKLDISDKEAEYTKLENQIYTLQMDMDYVGNQLDQLEERKEVLEKEIEDNQEYEETPEEDYARTELQAINDNK